MVSLQNCYTTGDTWNSPTKIIPRPTEQQRKDGMYTISNNGKFLTSIPDEGEKLATMENENAGSYSQIWTYKNKELSIYRGAFNIQLDGDCSKFNMSAPEGKNFYITSNSIFNERCGVYMGLDDSGIIVPVHDPSDTTYDKWVFTPVEDPQLEDGMYAIKTSDGTKSLWYANDGGAYSIVLVDYNDSYVWKYENDTLLLYIPLNNPLYLKFSDPLTLTTDPQDASGWIVTSNQIFGLDVDVIVDYCIGIENDTVKTTRCSTTEGTFQIVKSIPYNPGEAVDDGVYIISFKDDRVLLKDGTVGKTNKIIGWNYNSTTKQLNLDSDPTKFLAWKFDCSDKEGKLSVSTSDDDDTKRFRLTEKALYDEICKTCFVPSSQENYIIHALHPSDKNCKLTIRSGSGSGMDWKKIAMYVGIGVAALIFLFLLVKGFSGGKTQEPAMSFGDSHGRSPATLRFNF